MKMYTQPIDTSQISPNSGNSEQDVTKKKGKSNEAAPKPPSSLAQKNLSWATPGQHYWECSKVLDDSRGILQQ